ncbi:MAG: pyridoxal-phosphate-dependent aminotransferase family protein [Acidobacteriota bacterium]
MKQRLFTPGPTELLPEAQVAMSGRMPHHRKEDFKAIFAETRQLLRSIYRTEHEVLILASSGTGAMEGAVANLLSPGDEALVAVTGKFGERWVELCKAYGATAQTIVPGPGQAVDPSQIEQALAQNPNIAAVFVQACDTSTGVANDVEAIGAIVERCKDTCLVVDAITALGVSPVETDGWGLDVVVSGSQKAFMIPPGLAFVAVSPKACRKIEVSRSPRYYFDFRKELKHQKEAQSAWTPAISLIVGLHASLRWIESFGLDKLIANAGRLAAVTRAATNALGLEQYSRSPANAVTALKVPSGLSGGDLVRRLREEFGLVVAGGQGDLKGKIIRIAHLGYYDFLDTIGVLAGLEIALQRMGHPVELGCGVQAALREYAEQAPGSRLQAPGVRELAD